MLLDEINPLFVTLQTIDLDHHLLISITPDFLIEARKNLNHRDYLMIVIDLPATSFYLCDSLGLKVFEHHLSVYRNQGTSHRHHIHYTAYVYNTQNPDTHYQYHVYFDENFERNALPYFLMPVQEDMDILLLNEEQIAKNILNIEAICGPFFKSLQRYHHYVIENIQKLYDDSYLALAELINKPQPSPEDFFYHRKIILGLSWSLLKLDKLSYESYCTKKNAIEQMKRELCFYEVEANKEKHYLCTNRLDQLLEVIVLFQKLTFEWVTNTQTTFIEPDIQFQPTAFKNSLPIFEYFSKMNTELSPARLTKIQGQIEKYLAHPIGIHHDTLKEFIIIYEHINKFIALYLGKSLYFLLSQTQEENIINTMNHLKGSIEHIVLGYLVNLSRSHKIFNIKHLAKQFPQVLMYLKYINLFEFKHMILEHGLSHAFREDKPEILKLVLSELSHISISNSVFQYDSLEMNLLFLSYHMRKYQIFCNLAAISKCDDFLKNYLYHRSLLEETLISKNQKYYSVIFNFHIDIFSFEFFEQNTHLIPYLDEFISIHSQEGIQKMPLMHRNLFAYLNTQQFNDTILQFIQKLGEMADVLNENECTRYWQKNPYWKIAAQKSFKLINFYLQPPFIDADIPLDFANASRIQKCFEHHIQQFEKMLQLIILCKKYSLRLKINNSCSNGKLKALYQQMDKLVESLENEYSLAKVIKKHQYNLGFMQEAFSFFSAYHQVQKNQTSPKPDRPR